MKARFEMCVDGVDAGAREVVEFVLSLDELGVVEQAMLVVTVLGGEEFVGRMNRTTGIKYRRMVEAYGLPGPRPRRPGRPADEHPARVAAAARDRQAEARAWRERHAV